MMNDSPTQSSDQLDQVIADLLAAEEAGKPLDRTVVMAQHPELADGLREFFADQDRVNRLARALAGHSPTREFVPPKVRYFGNYELLEEIARGGMGVVYKARQTTLNRTVAVKLILSGHLASEEDVTRFKLEAQAAASLQHPSVVAVHEVGVHNGQHYFSMDFIKGQNLSEIIRDHPLPAMTAAKYVCQIAEAIHHAHQQGVLHRDLKPSNVLIDTNDEVQITDFGLATRVEGDSDLTRTGQILGTPSYMPPEQAQGKRGLIGPASDIYSLGAILYELLTGRPPFRAASAVETLRHVVEIEPLSPRQLNPSVPKDLETICLKCLEKEPHARFPTAMHLADDLKRFLEGAPIRSRPISFVARRWRWCRRNPLPALLMLSLLASIMAGTMASVTYAIKADQRRIDAERERSKAYRAIDTMLGQARRSMDEGDYTAALGILGEFGHEFRNLEFQDLASLIESGRKEVMHLREPVAFVDITADQGRCLAATYRGELHTTNLKTGKSLTVKASQWPIHKAGFDSKGDRICCGLLFGNVEAWSATSGKKLDDFHADAFYPVPKLDQNTNPEQLERIYVSLFYRISPVTYTDDFERVAGRSIQVPINTPTVWNAVNGKLIQRLVPDEQFTTKFFAAQLKPDSHLTFSKSGDKLLGQTLDGNIRLWDIASGDPEILFEEKEPVAALAITPGDRYVIVGRSDGSIGVWDRKTSKWRHKFRKHTGKITALAVTKSGRRIISGGDDLILRVWSIEAGTCLKTLKGHRATITCVQPSSDEDVFLAGDLEGRVVRWNLSPRFSR
jgi:eukaryotic-like serine/threonine-protein kinase